MPSEAERMIDLFTSVGARWFLVAGTDVNGKVMWARSYTAEELRKVISKLLLTSGARRTVTIYDGRTIPVGENLLTTPTSGSNVVFIKLDDLTFDDLERIRPASFLLVSASADHHQAWIAVSDIDREDLARRVRKRFRTADVTAPGNFALKAAPDSPMITIVSAVPGHVMTPRKLQRLGLLARKGDV